jgi:dipeptidyl aminopeptidase/acylaminoacyl peptidase
MSPHMFVEKWATPTLVIHGGKDYRVVDVEGLSTFTALQRRGIPSELLYFPEENHWVLNPNNRYEEFAETITAIDCEY